MKFDENFFSKYIETPSPSGYEMRLGGQKVWIDYVKPYTTKLEVDSYGNAYAYYESKNNTSGKTVVLDAHADEIGFFVFDITKDGFIKIGRLGGSDITITPSTRVNIWGKKGPVKGVFGHPAIHVQEKDYKPKIDYVFIDIGCSSKKDVEKKGITVGTPITMDAGYMELGDYHCGRALDDKIGGYITSQVLKLLHQTNTELPFDLVIVNAVQEEVGLHGAKMIAHKLNPDLVIAIDVTHDTDSPCYNKAKSGSLTAGEGIVIMNAPSLHKDLMDLLIETAKNKKIKYQITASGRSSGTNADAYAYPLGITTGLLKLAMRYMHTTVEMVHKKDVVGAIELLLATLQRKEIVNDFIYE